MEKTFPSPHGDKFQPWFSCQTVLPKQVSVPSRGYISTEGAFTITVTYKFPSPHGDKFQRAVVVTPKPTAELFPSPHRDKFQHGNPSHSDLPGAFPSPHGDIFQPGRSDGYE